MGVTEEAGKVASGTIEALKQQPLMLALILLQVFVLGAVLYNSIHRQEAISRDFARIYDLLEICLKKDTTNGLKLQPEQRKKSDQSGALLNLPPVSKPVGFEYWGPF